ncbi:MAG: hypothetical protein Ct9H300mP29_5710 [Candidatus Neomarinimicrobiota bacterium]|nr:MAG: hypothetical protein Ct9H300mP29_5710 [Candidatus Neomarinimicrobiota bacterium]
MMKIVLTVIIGTVILRDLLGLLIFTRMGAYDHHRQLNLWLQFGGHADGCYNLLEVALKETRKNLDLINLIPFRKNI